MIGLTPDSYEEFLRLAGKATVVPVMKHVNSHLATPVEAYTRVEGLSRYSFLLESAEGNERTARFSFVGYSPRVVIRGRNARVTIETESTREESNDNILQVLRRISATHIPAFVAGMPPLLSGAVGYMSYDAVRWFEKIPDNNRNDLDIDEATFIFFSNLLIFDHVKHQVYLVCNVFTEGRRAGLEENYSAALATIDLMEARLSGPGEPLPRYSIPQKLALRSNMTPEEYRRAVLRAKEYIAAGDIFQVVLSQRFEVSLSAHPFEVYRALRHINPSPYMFYLKVDGLSILGASPEMLLRIKDRQLEYRPIAGTRPRGEGADDDRVLADEMRSDEKELSEHVMLVDLGRNDLGRIAEYGSVRLTELMAIERYSHVMHLVSTLRARLKPGLSPFDALAACFPAGTVTGAPKVRAMEIIDELERTRRDVYAGAILYCDHAGNLDSCIAIRTIVAKGGRAYIQAGAGIVADSVPESEYEETLNKARAMIDAVAMAQNSQMKAPDSKRRHREVS